MPAEADKSKGDDKKPRGRGAAKQNISDEKFMIAMFFMACLCLPFLYYAHMIYTWAHENKPKGYKYTEYKQLWMTGMGAATFLCMKEFITLCVTPLYKNWIPKVEGDEDDVLW